MVVARGKTRWCIGAAAMPKWLGMQNTSGCDAGGETEKNAPKKKRMNVFCMYDITC
jgi:hypothetical protein